MGDFVNINDEHLWVELAVGYWISVGLNHLWVVESVWAVERVWVWIGLGYWIGMGWLFRWCWDVYGGWGFFESVWVGYFSFGISSSGAVGFEFVWLVFCFGFSGWLVVSDSGFCGFGGCVSLTCNCAPLRSHSFSQTSPWSLRNGAQHGGEDRHHRPMTPLAWSKNHHHRQHHRRWCHRRIWCTHCWQLGIVYRSLRDILGGVEFFGFILCLFPKKI